MVKSKTRRDAEILVRNPSPRLFGEKFRDSRKVNIYCAWAVILRYSCNYRPSSVYFILFISFFLFFCILFPFLRFGSDFRSHDYHVTGEHMVELGAIFCCCFFCKSKQFFIVQGHVHCIFKVAFLVQVQEAVFRE